MEKKFEVILFDIGGVLVEVSGFSKILAWVDGMEDENEMRNRWFSSPTMEAYHKGQISTRTFIKKMKEEFQLSVDESAFFSEYRNYPKSLYPGAFEMVKALKGKYTVASFSNNCALHWDKLCEEDKIDQLFHKNFLSHWMGMQKPDKEAYEYVLSHLDCDPQKILFLDDNEPNIEIGREMGMQAIRVDGFHDVKEKLLELGVLEL